MIYEQNQLIVFYIIVYLFVLMIFSYTFIQMYILCHAASSALLIAKVLLLFTIMFFYLLYNLIICHCSSYIMCGCEFHGWIDLLL